MLGVGACVLIRVKSPIPGMNSNRNSLAAISRAGKTYFSKVFCGFSGIRLCWESGGYLVGQTAEE